MKVVTLGLVTGLLDLAIGDAKLMVELARVSAENNEFCEIDYRQAKRSLSQLERIEKILLQNSFDGVASYSKEIA